MKIKVRDIPLEGIRFKETITADDLGFDEEGVEILSPLDVEVKVERAKDTLIVTGAIDGKYQIACARCLEPVEEERIDHFELFLEIGPKAEYIDLDEDIRQELVVDLAEIEFCSKDCKGLCVGCGKNLNKEKCTCKVKEGMSE